MFRWDNLGVLGLVCRLYSEREENEKNDDKRQESDTVETVEVEDDKRGKKQAKQQKLSTERIKRIERVKDDVIQAEYHLNTADNSSDLTDNDEIEDELTLFTLENEYLWD